MPKVLTISAAKSCTSLRSNGKPALDNTTITSFKVCSIYGSNWVVQPVPITVISGKRAQSLSVPRGTSCNLAAAAILPLHTVFREFNTEVLNSSSYRLFKPLYTFFRGIFNNMCSTHYILYIHFTKLNISQVPH